MALLWGHRHGELDPFGYAGAHHFLGAECRVAAQQDRGGGPASACGGDGLLDLAGGRTPGTGPPAAQLRLGDNGCGGGRGEGGDLGGQAQPQQGAVGDLGVSVGGALFAVPVDRAQQRVDVQKRVVLDAG